MQTLAEKILEHLAQRVQNNELTNNEIIEVIDLLGGYLNLETISDYSKRTGISYNGVLARIESGKIKEYKLFNTKFVIDND